MPRTPLATSSQSRATPLPTPRRGTPSNNSPLGEKELLAWAEATSGVYPCTRLAHLGDGLVLLGLVQRLYPKRIRRDRLTACYKGKARAAANWDLLHRCMTEQGLPTCVTNTDAIARGVEGDCLNSLVLFYFLFRLARSESFTVDFTFPVDPRIANFLQSPASLAAVGKGTAATHRSSDASHSARSSRGSSRIKARVPTHKEGRGGVWAEEGGRMAEQERLQTPESSSQPFMSSSSSSVSTGLSEASAVSGDAYLTAMLAKMGRARRRDGKATMTASTVVTTPRAALPQGERQPRQVPAVPLTTSSDVHALRVDVALLREEVAHERAVRRLLQSQQDGQLEVQLARAAEDSAMALAKLKLDHAHELRQLHSVMAAAWSSPSETRATSTARTESELAAEERVPWERALADCQRRHTAFAQIMQTVFAAISAIAMGDSGGAGAGGGDGLATETAASSAPDSYEEAMVDSLLTQMSNQLEPVLVDALAACLRSLLATLRQLRASNARLQWEQDHATAVVGGGHHESAERAEKELEAARRSVATLSASLAESQRQRQQLEKDLATVADHVVPIPSSTDEADEADDARTQRWAERLRESEERYAALALHASICEDKAARDAQECRRLYDRVTSLITHFCSMGGGGDAKWTTTALGLEEALRQWYESRGTLDAMEAALQEQCETIAQLRRQLRLCRGDAAAESMSRTGIPPSPPSPRTTSTADGADCLRHKSPVGGTAPPALCLPPSGLLSPEELERRKRAILTKYTPSAEARP